MVAENKEKFLREYQAGKAAFENGQYRLSIKYLEAASQILPPNSRLTGEAQIWLVTAYQAAGMTLEAISLCRQLCTHPFLETRKQAKRLLYIIEAPELKRPKEWMTEIPDLGAIAEGKQKYVTTKQSSPRSSAPTKISIPEPIDPNLIDTKDNQFIWFALLLVLLTAGWLVFGS
jgi:hypothetical protein